MKHIFYLWWLKQAYLNAFRKKKTYIKQVPLNVLKEKDQDLFQMSLEINPGVDVNGHNPIKRKNVC